ncbi:MAG: hypothetical protein ACLQBY_01465 [Solirubrobacteraceae bacterium]
MSAFIEEYRAHFGVEPICETLSVSASAYYQRATGQRSARQLDDERLLGVITELHARNYYAYGSRRMWKARLRSGERAGRNLAGVSEMARLDSNLRPTDYEDD